MNKLGFQQSGLASLRAQGLEAMGEYLQSTAHRGRVEVHVFSKLPR